MAEHKNLEPDEECQTMSERVIIIPVDKSDISHRAIDWYVENMMRTNDMVHLVHIVEPIYNTVAVGIGLEAAWIPLEELNVKIDKLIVKGKVLVKNYIHELTGKGGKCRGFIRVDSRVGECIISVCHDHNANVILMANRGEGLLRRTFLGSVSDYVLHHADRPVIIVPPLHK